MSTTNFEDAMSGDENILMLSLDWLDQIDPHDIAARALIDLFLVYGRRPFHPDDPALERFPRWSGPGMRERLAQALSELCDTGPARPLPRGRYQIVTTSLMTGAEFHAAYPDAGCADDVGYVEVQLGPAGSIADVELCMPPRVWIWSPA